MSARALLDCGSLRPLPECPSDADVRAPRYITDGNISVYSEDISSRSVSQESSLYSVGYDKSGAKVIVKRKKPKSEVAGSQSSKTSPKPPRKPSPFTLSLIMRQRKRVAALAQQSHEASLQMICLQGAIAKFHKKHNHAFRRLGELCAPYPDFLLPWRAEDRLA